MTPEQSKARAKDDARRRAAELAASGVTSQINRVAPQAYRLGRVNQPANLGELTMLVHGELLKIEQSQSLILSLYRSFSPAGKDSSDSVDIVPLPDTVPGSFFEFGANKEGTITYIDFHNAEEPADTDYSARIRVDVTPASVAPELPGSMELYASQLKVQTRSDSPCLVASATRQINDSGNDAWVSPNDSSRNAQRWKFPFEASDWTIRNDGTGTSNVWGGDMNTAPAACTFFSYAGGQAVANAPSHTGPTISWYGISAGYQCQMVAEYGSGGNKLSWRTANGDSHTWNAWNVIASTKMLEDMRRQVKAEIYAELAAMGVITAVPAQESVDDYRARVTAWETWTPPGEAAFNPEEGVPIVEEPTAQKD